jgi:7-cyano-7-deazaguanine reductase
VSSTDASAKRSPRRTPNPSTLAPDLSRVDLKRLRGTLIAVVKPKRTSQLTLLGRSDAKMPASPAQAQLETFPNPAPKRNYQIHFETDDFTSVCPVTGQPDFARIDIDYVPDRFCVESKSLKFYLASYRNERAFNEAVTNRILDDFVKACSPREAIVTAQFSARGGIALTVRAAFPDERIGK